MRIVSTPSRGYVLPSVILLSIGTSILLAAFLQYIISASTGLNSQIYQSYATEAAQAGISYIRSCLESNATAANWTTVTLRPNTTCTGSTNPSAVSDYVHETGEWRTDFSVTATKDAANRLNVTSVGRAYILQGGATVSTIQTEQKVTLPETTETLLVADDSTLGVLTDISTETHSCAIAKGQLYCWGYNTAGQLGLGDVNSRHTPTLVSGPWGSDPVTKVVVGTWNTCAIAGGQLYCWGDNSWGQLGRGDTSYLVANRSPNLINTAGMKVVDLSLTQGTYLPKAACGIVNGAGYCWGANNVQQVGQANYNYNIFCLCWSSLSSSPETSAAEEDPLPVFGYRTDRNGLDSNSALYRKKLTSISVGEGQATAIAEGNVYQWGNPNDGGSTTRRPTLANSGALSGRIMDPWSARSAYATWCATAQGNMICYGYNWRPLWGGTVCNVAPQLTPTLYHTGNILAYDGGTDNEGKLISGCGLIPVWINSIDCVLDYGTIKCAGAGSYTGTGLSGMGSWNPLYTTTDMQGKIPTKIGIGKFHGCFIANGSLLCWGSADHGQLGDGVMNSSSTYAKSVATNMFGPGTDPVTGKPRGAATGPITVGGEHACGIVNAQLFCWGDNSLGQLGIGTTESNKSEPVSVMAGTVFTKVSAGTNHTCAIANAQLYCWGDNSSRQLGIGDIAGEQRTPQLVSSLLGKYVTDVSAGDSGTCAIVDNQAFCWGSNSAGQIGDNNPSDLTTLRNVPTQVTGGGDILTNKAVSAISMGKQHACAVANGNGYCWGANTLGATGLGLTSGRSAPTQITGGTAANPSGFANLLSANFTDIQAGNNFTCGVINGTVSCWGNGNRGQLGNGSTSDQSVPGLLSGSASNLQADDLSVGDTHACANLQGATYCWGNAGGGRLGNGNTSPNETTPQLISGGDNSSRTTVSIAAGLSSSCNVANGRIQCWGVGTNGKLANGSTVGTELTPKTTLNYKILTPYNKGTVY